MDTKYGYPAKDWDEAKEEIRVILIEKAKNLSLLTYGDLCKKLTVIPFKPRLSALYEMLDQIAEKEDDAKRGMLAAIVVAEATMQPGDGFYTLAKKRGRDISSKLKCWFEELSQVWKYWRRN